MIIQYMPYLLNSKNLHHSIVIVFLLSRLYFERWYCVSLDDKYYINFVVEILQLDPLVVQSMVRLQNKPLENLQYKYEYVLIFDELHYLAE